MGWYTDHMDNVALRWARRFRESKMTETKFRKHMKKTLLEYGWSESETNTIVTKAIEKGRA